MNIIYSFQIFNLWNIKCTKQKHSERRDFPSSMMFKLTRNLLFYSLIATDFFSVFFGISVCHYWNHSDICFRWISKVFTNPQATVHSWMLHFLFHHGFSYDHSGKHILHSVLFNQIRQLEKPALRVD